MTKSIDFTIAQFVVNTDYNGIPQRVIEVAKKSILDTLGVTLAASTLGEGCKEFVKLAERWGGRESTILGFGVKTSPPMAAFANGSMAHALDYEEIHDKALVHPSAQTFPALLAISESIGGVSGKDFMAAFVLGNELTVRLGLALTRNPLELGWYPPPILGAMGATVAGSKLLGLSEREVLSALSLTLCQTSCSAEIIYSPKSVIRAVRDAFPAMAAVISPMLAKEGIAGFERPISGEGGFFRMYARDNYQSSMLMKDLGKIYEYVDVSLKPWPSCRGTHPFIQAAIAIAEENDIRAEEVGNVHLLVGPLNRMLCEPIESKRAPRTSIEAKFSLPFTVATALIERRVGLDSFLEHNLANKEVLDLAKKVTYEVKYGYKPTEGEIIIKNRDGRSYLKKVDSDELYGTPSNPLTKDFLMKKFVECCRYSALKPHEESIEEVIKYILNLEKVEDVGVLTSILHRAQCRDNNFIVSPIQ
jgi:2-methylcitrate dehydratase PrpD